MINRELIRQKVVHVIYAHQTNSSQNVSAAEKNLIASMDNAYELYHTLLSLIAEIGRLAQRNHEAAVNRAKRLGIAEPNAKFVNNRFLLQLQANRQLQSMNGKEAINWDQEEEFVRTLLAKATRLEAYEDYMYSETSSYEEDRELWRAIYRKVIIGNEALEDILEDNGLYWNDDKDIIDTFVLKTINRFAEENGEEQTLLPQFRSEEDRTFALELLHATLQSSDASLKLIAESTKGWDVERVALMDRIIMQIALAEIQTFPSIPVDVSIEKYVEIAKMYSTPKSARYINATLTNLVGQMTLNKIDN